MIDEYREGIFIKESKNRFLCEVLIDNQIQECYLPCSSKISDFICLTNKKVILRKNKGNKTKTQFSLFAVCNGDNNILLDLNYLNVLVKEQLYNIDSKREGYVTSKLRSDIYIPNNETIIEVKGIISDKKNVVFPSIKAKRAEEQLIELKKLLLENKKVEYVIVLTNEKIEEIQFNPLREVFKKRFQECIELGMNVYIYSLKYANQRYKLISKQYELN